MIHCSSDPTMSRSVSMVGSAMDTAVRPPTQIRSARLTSKLWTWALSPQPRLEMVLGSLLTTVCYASRT